MPVTDEQRAFWSQKNPAEEFDTVMFRHPAFDDDIRLIANVYSDRTIGGSVYRACAMEVSPPEQGSDPVSSATLKFAREVIGDELKAYLRKLDAFDWMTPVTMTLRHYSELDFDNPMQSWTLYVDEDGIKISGDAVNITATDDNPMILDVSAIYDIERYPALSYL